MANVSKLFALGMTMSFVMAFGFVFAQDDLDDLLRDLENETTTNVNVAVKPEAAVSAAVEAPAETAEPVKEEVVAEAPAEVVEPAKEEVVAEVPAEVVEPAKEEVAAEAPVAEALAEAEAPAEAVEPAKEEVVAEAPAVVAAATDNSDAELLNNIRATEKLRREALDQQAKREIIEARSNMKVAEYDEAVRHYGLALKLLNDRPSSKKLRRECEQGIASGLYKAAMQEDEIGRRDRAIKLMEKAIDMRHPKARRMLEKWNSEVANNDNHKEESEVHQRRNDESYKTSRDQIRKHLRRANSYLALRDLRKALEECEIVMANDPYNEEAIRLRKAIQKKRHFILEKERDTARDGMIADVDEAWRPVYAVNAAHLKDISTETVKTKTGTDPESTVEQEIERRMKEMRLPTISFKPPATIIDAVEFFRTASKDYDRPDLPIEKRGFNFVLKTPQGAIKQQAAADNDEADGFSADAEEDPSAPSNGLPPIPTIAASDISFYDALKLVCDSVEYKFIVRGPIVMVMHKDMSTAELLSRKYDVLDAFLDRMSSASSDIKEMRQAGFGGGNNRRNDDNGEENQEKDWKAFFEQLGVKWPEGSSIMYIKTLGKLYVRNTRENLAEFEKVLDEMGSQPKLIEIETRFVEVSQEDLNSLGFEWILNSDYSLNVGDKLGKALGLKNGVFGSESGSKSWSKNGDYSAAYNDSVNNYSKEIAGSNTKRLQNGILSTLDSYDKTVSDTTINDRTFRNNSKPSFKDSYTRDVPYKSNGANWIRGTGDKRNIGVNAFGGTDSNYNRGNRYLSDTGNHISGEGASNNDQFMRVNAFLGAADLSLILHMLAQRSDTDLLSAPKVVTKSGENAVIKVVTEYIYPQDYDVQIQSSGGSGGSYGGSYGGGSSQIMAIVEPQNFTMREVGVILDVTPTYSEANGGTIDLELKPQVVDEPTWHNYGMKLPFSGNTANGNSNSAVPDFGGIIDSMVNAVTTLGATLTDETKNDIAGRVVNSSLGAIDNLSAVEQDDNMSWYDAPMEQPFFHLRSIDSKVSITPGATVVMGGLITEQRKAMDDKVPFLGDLPFIGRLFRSHAEQTIKRNLLIFVTGRLITPSGREIAVNSETTSDDAEVKPAPKAE